MSKTIKYDTYFCGTATGPDVFTSQRGSELNKLEKNK